MEPLLTATDISKKYKRKSVLEHVNFTVYQGNILGIVGANGCGKSTLLKILSGVLRPDSGLISTALKISDIGYVPQENPLYDSLTVHDNLKLWCAENNLTKQNRQNRIQVRHQRTCCEHPLQQDKINSNIEELLNKFELDNLEKSLVKNLSGGQKKRVSIACTLISAPKLLILDEPGAALDVVSKEYIKGFIKQYVLDGGTIIISSHEETELSLCTRMLLIKEHSLAEIEPVKTAAELAKLIL